jgi:flavin-dependent dehydrogenase
MEIYDVIVVGGGIGGSVAARFSASHGFSTLLVERFKTPRNKPCSGIQFPYLEKLVGEKIPREALCKNELHNVEMITPNGKVTRGRMKMLNFWRSNFDSWLNSRAVHAGAHFLDDTKLIDLDEGEERITVTLLGKEGERKISTRFLIGGDGLNSTIRKRLQPPDFKRKAWGATINYYFDGEANLDPNTLYMFYNREFCPLMFAWVYRKDDWWVIGTGADRDLLQYARRFLSYVQEKYAIRGKMVRKEGFSSPMDTSIYLGRGNILMVGDAAGLVDLYRGLGMDNAALSGRLAVKAIVKSEQTNHPPIELYEQCMKGIVHKIDKNKSRQVTRYNTNDSLQKSLSPANLIKDGILMLTVAQIDKLLPAERVITLPL